MAKSELVFGELGGGGYDNAQLIRVDSPYTKLPITVEFDFEPDEVFVVAFNYYTTGSQSYRLFMHEKTSSVTDRITVVTGATANVYTTQYVTISGKNVTVSTMGTSGFNGTDYMYIIGVKH
jgi:hypothetical protein